MGDVCDEQSDERMYDDVHFAVKRSRERDLRLKVEMFLQTKMRKTTKEDQKNPKANLAADARHAFDDVFGALHRSVDVALIDLNLLGEERVGGNRLVDRRDGLRLQQRVAHQSHIHRAPNTVGTGLSASSAYSTTTARAAAPACRPMNQKHRQQQQRNAVT